MHVCTWGIKEYFIRKHCFSQAMQVLCNATLNFFYINLNKAVHHHVM